MSNYFDDLMNPKPTGADEALRLTWRGRSWWPQEFAVCMAMDAFRLCLFGKPSNFTKREVIAWIEATSKE